MKTSSVSMVRSAAALLALLSLQCASVSAASDTQAPSISADEQTIRSQAQAYANAFSAADVKALGAMWSADGSLTDVRGHVFKGRTAIEDNYAGFFNRFGKQPLEVTVTSVKFPSPDVAIEEGTGKLLNSTTPVDICRYQVVHVRKDGKWEMVSAAETPYVAVDSKEYLKELSWLVGDWKAQGPAGSMRFSADWISNRNFISCAWYADGSNQPSEMEVIGWDPASEQISSWHFGANGGSGHASWRKDKSSWIVQGEGVQPGGAFGRAEYTFKKVDNNNFTWKSDKRSLNGMQMPTTDEIKVTRVNK